MWTPRGLSTHARGLVQASVRIGGPMRERRALRNGRPHLRHECHRYGGARIVERNLTRCVHCHGMPREVQLTYRLVAALRPRRSSRGRGGSSQRLRAVGAGGGVAGWPLPPPRPTVCGRPPRRRWCRARRLIIGCLVGWVRWCLTAFLVASCNSAHAGQPVSASGAQAGGGGPDGGSVFALPPPIPIGG